MVALVEITMHNTPGLIQINPANAYIQNQTPREITYMIWDV